MSSQRRTRSFILIALAALGGPTLTSGAVAAPRQARIVISTRGVTLPVVARRDGRLFVRTPCGRTIAAPAGRRLAGATVVLDAGHGGNEPGARAPTGLKEKDVNLSVTRRVAGALEAAGVSAVQTRTADYRVTLATRARIVTVVRPRAFVSVHHNADPDGPRDAPGSETYYQLRSTDSKRLAGLIYEEVVRALAPYRVPWVGDRDAGAKYRTNRRGGDYYAMLRTTAGTPSVLAELAFMSNRPEAELLVSPEVQQVEGDAVARGILRYLRTADPGSGFTTPYPRTTPAGPGGGSKGCRDPAL